MSVRLLFVVALLGCALPAWGFFSGGFRTASVLSLRNRLSAVASRQRNTLPIAGRSFSHSLRMSDDSTSVKEQCDGPAKEGQIGNVDVSAAKVVAEDIKTDGIITLSESAKKQIIQLRKARGDAELVLRVGVRSGGCSGMSYVMEFEEFTQVGAMDTELKFDGFRVVVDPKSLMFVYGMTLDYSDALIGGGFKFNNPNAASTCGCGQSFGA